MNVKRIKRMCSVKGCHNIDTYAISRIKEFGGVIICKSCLETALQAIETAGNETVKKKRQQQPLFYHPVIEEKKEPDIVGEKSEKNTDEDYICPKCGRRFETERGLKTHQNTCGGKQQ